MLQGVAAPDKTLMTVVTKNNNCDKKSIRLNPSALASVLCRTAEGSTTPQLKSALPLLFHAVTCPSLQ